MKKLYSVLAILTFTAMAPAAQATVATFDDLSLSPNSSWHGGGSDGSSGFTSGDNFFNTYYNASWGYWEGVAYSNMTDTTTAGYTNQFSAITGGGVNGSANYAVAYTMTYAGDPATTYNGITSGNYAQTVNGMYVTNTTYTYLSMLEGDAFAKSFGGTDGTDADWFKLTIYGLNEAYERSGVSTDFYLADYRFDNSAEDYILNQWAWVDLTSLGTIYGLEFELTSSDTGMWGMNTPAYFAMDNLVTTTSPVPVPGTAWLLTAGLAGLSGFRRKQRV